MKVFNIQGMFKRTQNINRNIIITTLPNLKVFKKHIMNKYKSNVIVFLKGYLLEMKMFVMIT